MVVSLALENLSSLSFLEDPHCHPPHDPWLQCSRCDHGARRRQVEGRDRFSGREEEDLRGWWEMILMDGIILTGNAGGDPGRATEILEGKNCRSGERWFLGCGDGG